MQNIAQVLLPPQQYGSEVISWQVDHYISNRAEIHFIEKQGFKHISHEVPPAPATCFYF